MVAILLVTYLLGLLATNVFGSRIIQKGEWLLLRIPLFRSVYATSKQLIESFSGTTTTGFKRVVAIEFPRPNAWVIGFLTGTTLDEHAHRWAIIYIPTAPMPNSGWVNLIPLEQVYDTNLSVQAAMSMVLSGGIRAPAKVIKTPIDVSSLP